MAQIQINEGFAEKLLRLKTLNRLDARGITERMLTAEMNDDDICVIVHNIEGKKVLEISDIRGSFIVTFPLTQEIKDKIK